jgi:hypothetical protein
MSTHRIEVLSVCVLAVLSAVLLTVLVRERMRIDGRRPDDEPTLIPVTLVSALPSLEAWCSEDDVRRFAVDSRPVSFDVERGCFVA